MPVDRPFSPIGFALRASGCVNSQKRVLFYFHACLSPYEEEDKEEEEGKEARKGEKVEERKNERNERLIFGGKEKEQSRQRTRRCMADWNGRNGTLERRNLYTYACQSFAHLWMLTSNYYTSYMRLFPSDA